MKARWIIGIDEAGRGPLAGPVVITECPAASAITGAYLRSLSVKEGSANWKKVINNITKRTGSNGDLWAAHACDEGYGDMVRSAVNVIRANRTIKKDACSRVLFVLLKWFQHRPKQSANLR